MDTLPSWLLSCDGSKLLIKLQPPDRDGEWKGCLQGALLPVTDATFFTCRQTPFFLSMYPKPPIIRPWGCSQVNGYVCLPVCYRYFGSDFPELHYRYWIIDRIQYLVIPVRVMHNECINAAALCSVFFYLPHFHFTSSRIPVGEPQNKVYCFC